MPRTVIEYIGQHGGSGKRSLEHLFRMLAEHPLDRTFEAYGDYLETPVWSKPPRDGWAADGSDGECMFWGNFFDWAYTFNLTTNDPELIERIRVAVEQNRARADFQAQAPQPMSMTLLRDYVRDLGIGCPRWEGDDEITERTVIVLRRVDDDDIVECQLRHDGAVVDYLCNRRALKAALVRLCRTRRPELGYSVSDILGPVADPQPGTLVEALALGHTVAHRDIKPENEPGPAGQLQLL
jgi:hypothetical protein